MNQIIEWHSDIGIGFLIFNGEKLAFKRSSLEVEPSVGLPVKSLSVERGFATKIVVGMV